MKREYNRSVLSHFCMRLVRQLEDKGHELTLKQRSIYWETAKKNVSLLYDRGLEDFCFSLVNILEDEGERLTQIQRAILWEEAQNNVELLEDLFNVQDLAQRVIRVQHPCDGITSG